MAVPTNIGNLLACTVCGASLRVDDKGATCTGCGATYPMVHGKLVLTPRDSELFPHTKYQDQSDSEARHDRAKPSGWRPQSYLPGRSINLARDRQLKALSERLPENSNILIVGCGNQRQEIEAYFGGETTLVFTDVDPSSDSDLFADAHTLPFQDMSFDAVITTAVLEHILEPWVGASEIERVVKLGGYLYSELPFLQGVHEGAYDFTRFTLVGHRALFRYFSEIELGVVAGSGTGFVWASNALAKSIFSNRRLIQLMNYCSLFFLGWLKYLDNFIANRAHSIDNASCTFFLGKRVSYKVSETAIIGSYKRTQR